MKKNMVYFLPIFLLLFIAATQAFSVEIIDLALDTDTQHLLQSTVRTGNTEYLLDLASDEGLVELISITKKETGKIYTRYNQTYNSLPVVGYQVITGQSYNGITTDLRGKLVRGIGNELTLTRTVHDEATVIEQVKRDHIQTKGSTDLNAWLFEKESIRKVIYIHNNKPVECYEVTFLVHDKKGIIEPAAPLVYLETTSLTVIRSMNTIKTENATGPGGNFKIGKYLYGTDFDYLKVKALNTTPVKYGLMNDMLLSNGQQVSVAIIDYRNTMGGMTHTFETLHNEYKPVNGAYCPMNDALYYVTEIIEMYDEWFQECVLNTNQITVGCHYGVDIENAYFGMGSIRIGDGKDRFYPFTCLDVIAHELGHGYTDKYSQLIYENQSGGVNEAFSDMSGKAGEYYIRGYCNWNVGGDVIKEGEGLRFMYDPPKDGKSIGSANDFVTGMDVHYSSGVFNKAFYLLATSPGWNVKKAFEVFAFANQAYWTPDETFVSAAEDARDAAAALGYSVTEIIDAFRAVDINLTNVPTPTPTQTPQPTPIYTNVALNKKVTASGQFSAQFPKTAVNDGLDTTVWGSLYNAGSQWVFIDLEKATDIDHVMIKFFDPYFSPYYHVGISDDAVTWSFAATETNGNGGDDKLMINKTARYVGILLTKGAQKVYGVKEVEVYTRKDIIIPTPTPTSTPTPTPTVTEYPIWTYNTNYAVGFRVRYNNKKWECITPHYALADWGPGEPGVNLWTEIQ